MSNVSPGFSVFANAGFQIRLENGWTVSVQFAVTNYCANRDLGLPAMRTQLGSTCKFADEWSSPDAEIAAWDKDGDWYQFPDDAVKGWVTPGEVLKFINMIAGKK